MSAWDTAAHLSDCGAAQRSGRGRAGCGPRTLADPGPGATINHLTRMNAHDWTLILVATASVGLLVLLVTRFKLNAFLGLLLAALALGLGAGLKMSKALAAFQDGL